MALFKGDSINEVIEGLSLEQKVGQLIAPRAMSLYAARDSSQYQQLIRLVEDFGVGGFVFFQGEVFGQALLAAELQSRTRIPLLFSQDAEWGVGMRLDDATTFPNMMGIAASRSTDLAYQVGRVTAEEAKALGVCHVFAPVADINNNAANPIINVRSFGEDPETVSQMTVAVVRGLQENGVLATAKHFPGHGDTATDSHSDLPVLDADEDRLDRLELLPFRAAIRAGVKSIMVGHLAMPKLGDPPDLPATLSRRVTTDLLRERLGFDGLIVTDAMDMQAVQKLFPPGEAAVRAIEAGADMLLVPPDPVDAHQALVEAVRKKRVTVSRIDQSVVRVLTAKAEVGLLGGDSLPNVEHVRRTIACTKHLDAARAASSAALTLLRNEGGVLPLDASGKSVTVVALSDLPHPTGVAASLVDFIRDRVGQVQTIELGAESDSSLHDRALHHAVQADVVVLAAFVAVRSYSGKIGLPPAHADFIQALNGLEKPTVLVSFGSPYVIADLPQAPDAYAVAFGGSESAQEAVAAALTGESGFSGRLPVTIPGQYTAGSGLDLRPAVA